jgi:hypothetical protein
MNGKKRKSTMPSPARRTSVLLLIIFLMTMVSMSCLKKKAVIIESDFKIVEVDKDYYKVSKALWRRMLLKIAKLEKELAELKLEKGK